METRIREFRKRRGLTLQQLAAMVGTTAQTVQRLETANMTVSTDWLERFAQAFGVHPAELIKGGGGRSVEYLGLLGSDGVLREDAAQPSGDYAIDVPADDPVAVRLERGEGPYPAGTLLIANRLKGDDLVNAHGTDCLVQTAHGGLILRRVIAGTEGAVTLVPYAPGQDVRYNQRVDWLARIVMSIRYH